MFYFIMFGYLLEPCSFLMRDTEETQKGGEMGRAGKSRVRGNYDQDTSHEKNEKNRILQ